ncbi:MAG: carboxypeptidase regulatory-like domain-containing protein [Candidatus Sulfotelmatobacter sp.]
MRKTFLLVVLLISATVIGLAQVDTGSLVGTVKDASGAVLPGVTVTATNVDTGVATTAKTEQNGDYVITPLHIGRYSVSVEATGFRREIRKDIVLDVQQTIRLDFSLKVGSISETMEVSGAPPLLETENASLGDVVTAETVEELPLNGRRYTDLAELTSGVAKVIEGPVNGGNTPTNGNAGGSFAVNGTRGDQNNFILDGIDNNSNDNGDVAVLSSVDAIAEFKIETSNYSPEFGRSGGAVINATTKSGTNKFHGSAWEFLRNDALDSAQYGFGTSVPKAPYKQNQFGGTFGGPIKRDKAFFFLDYEGTRIRLAPTDIVTVPTDGTNGTSNERNGDFSGILGGPSTICGPNADQACLDALGRPVFTNEIYDPATTQQVPAGCGTGSNPPCQIVRNGFGFDPTTGLPIAGQANIIPAGSLNSLGLNYAALYPALNNPGTNNNDYTTNNYVVNAPGTDRVDQMDVRVDENVSDKTQLFQRFSFIKDTRFQAPVFSGIADGGGYNTGGRPLNTEGTVVGWNYAPKPNMVNAFRAGFNRVHYISNSPSYGQQFPPANLQVPGVPNDPLVNGLTWFDPSPYAGLGEPLYTPTRSTSQDIQINDTLSIVHGKHLIKLGPQFRFDQFNLLQIGQPRGNLTFDGQFTSSSGAGGDGSGNGLADMLVEQGYPISAAISTEVYFGNRQHTYGAFVQDTYRATSKLTLDLGLRWDYATPVYESQNRQGNWDYTKPGGVLVCGNKSGQYATSDCTQAGTAGYPKHLETTDKDNFAPRIGLSYSPSSSKPFVIRAGYGRLFVFYVIRTGDPLQVDYNLPYFFEPTFNSDGITPSLVNLAPGGGFTGLLDPANAPFANVTSQDWNPHTPVYDQWNLNLEYQLPGQIVISPGYVGTKGTHLQVLRDLNQIPTPQPTYDPTLAPYCNPTGGGNCKYGTFTSILNSGNSTYHAFQIKAEKRATHGLYFLSAFTFGKAINDQPEICCNAPWPQDSYNIAAEKGLADFDNRKRWVNSVDYQLPLGKGQQFLNRGGVTNAILGGWHIGGIITLRSGFPFSPIINFDPSNTGSPGLQRSNQTGTGAVAHPNINMWFNPADFPPPNPTTCPNGCFGNAGKNILEGPGEKTADLDARKLFNLTERVNLEFRAEFFNAFNHAVFSQPDNVMEDGSVGTITSTVIPQRQIQFALKLAF